MALAEHPPELADAGFWYVVPVVETQIVAPQGGAVRGGVVRAPQIQAGEWCAWYAQVDGQQVAVVRTPTPLLGVDVRPVPAGRALALAGLDGKPRGRVGGR